MSEHSCKLELYLRPGREEMVVKPLDLVSRTRAVGPAGKEVQWAGIPRNHLRFRIPFAKQF